MKRFTNVVYEGVQLDGPSKVLISPWLQVRILLRPRRPPQQYAPVAELAYALDSKSRICGFESHREYHWTSSRIGICAGLRSQSFRVRLSGGSPMSLQPNWHRHYLEGVEFVGSNPTRDTKQSGSLVAKAGLLQSQDRGFKSLSDYQMPLQFNSRISGSQPEEHGA